MMTRPDSTSMLSGIKLPTLVIVGEEDTLTPPPLSVEMHTAITASELVRIPGGWPYVESRAASSVQQRPQRLPQSSRIVASHDSPSLHSWTCNSLTKSLSSPVRVRGLGAATAIALVQEGCRVVVCARGEAQLAGAAAALRQLAGSPDRVLPIVADVGHRLRAWNK